MNVPSEPSVGHWLSLPVCLILWFYSRERDQSLGSEGRGSDEADPQLLPELVSMRSKQDEAITEIESLKLTNQEQETRLQQIQQE
ncbi:hypothetical protein scyTo_0022426, partial [Scyliorhinus torazame]|nr:hypothetical protein [Scyliorhinus torazame]